MKVKTKISRYIFLKLIKRGILRGGPVWFSMGVLATFLKIISVFEDREKKYLSLQLKPGDNVSFRQSLRR
ncbi:MAG: hypothetical protein CL423_03080 [Acidimicrobiaceae bacterium]|jgi:hypothetical protein|nr:hypothetical protein [Acidimicrobiaceae bacterium]HAY50706.1 hypothetical protein [Acidimicrobiaceae bacterium]|tara:strand:+ start:40 stop:249 length:210 start_codon:yes stop_codon:yes gene_type:complete